MSTIEHSVRSIWVKFLNLENIDHEGDFFELGGDSILALNMLFETSAELGVDIPPVALFENPTLREFSKFVELQLAATKEPAR